MNNDKKKELITGFFNAFGSNSVSDALACLDEKATWRVMGREGGMPISGEMDPNGITELMGTVADTLVDGLKLMPHAWTIEGERVALEMESYGEKADGTVYNNHYHFLVTVSNNKITALREYGDTYHVWRVFIKDA